MTNEEFIKSLTGQKLIDYMSRILTVDLAKYVDWEKWLSSPKGAFVYKGIPGDYIRTNGEKEPCIVVEKKMVFDTAYCRIVLFDKSHKPYILDVLEDKIECKNI